MGNGIKMAASKDESEDSSSISSNQSDYSRILKCLNYENETVATSTTTLKIFTNNMNDITALQPYIKFDIVKSIFTPLRDLYSTTYGKTNNFMKLCWYPTSMLSFQLPANEVLCYVVEDNSTQPRKKCFCKRKTSDQKCTLHRKSEDFDKPLPQTSTIPKCPCVDNLEIQPQNFSKKLAPTKSLLELAIQTTQEKCTEKDGILAMMTNELAKQSNAGIFETMVQEIALCDTDAPDYSIQLLEQEHAALNSCGCDTAGSAANDCFCNVSSEPLKIIKLQKLTPTTCLVKWIRAASPEVTAYEIYLNGNLVYVTSGDKEHAVVSIDATLVDIQINLFASTKEGRCYPEAIALTS